MMKRIRILNCIIAGIVILNSIGVEVALAADVQNYTVQSNDITQAIEFDAQPEDVVCAGAGEKVSFSVSVRGTGLKYQWQYKMSGSNSWINFSSATEATLNKTAGEWDGWKVHCIVTDITGNSLTSEEATIHFESKLKITGQPKDVIVSKAGDSVEFAVSAEGDGLKYQWQYKVPGSSWTNFANATGAILKKMTGEWDGWKIHCVVTDKNGNSVTTEEAAIHFESKLKITSQPKDVTVSKAGDSVGFAVSAEGDGLKYQWQYKAPGSSSWTNFANATNATLKKVTGEWDGWKVHCVVTDKNGNSVTTEEAAIHFGRTLKITSQPKDVAVSKAGDSVEFAVTAEGDGLKYQWQYKAPGSSSWTNFANATGAILKKMTGEWDGWKIHCVVTDKNGNSVTTEEAAIHFESKLKITSQPKDVTVSKAGDSVEFAVSAEGDGLKYQWQYKAPGSSSWTNFANATNATLKKVTGEWDGWKVHCVVTDKNGNSVTTEEAAIHFGRTLKITSQPKDVAVSKAGDSVEFAVTAEGDGLKYQWQYKAPGSSSWTNFANATGAILKKMTGEWDGWKIHCVVTDKNGNSVTTEEAAIHFESKLKITSQPKDVTVSKAGDSVEFAVSAEGDGLKYQWQYKAPGSSSWTNFANATGATLKKVTGEWAGWKVRCVVTDKEGKSETSKEAQILFATPLKITKQPTTLTFQTPGDIIEMEIVATGTNLKYQWQYKPSWASTWSNFENADTALVQKEAQAGWNGWSVRCVITDAFGNTVTSDEVKIVNTGKEDAEVYNVTFDANGGYFVHEDGTETSTVQTTADSELPVLFYEDPIIDDDTKVFGGWYDNKACTGKAIGEKENYVDKDTTFYAKWVDACVVTFEGNGGTFDYMPRFDAKVPKNSSLSNNTIGFDPREFAHPSKTLAGWSTDPDGKNMISEYELYRTKFTENTTFYAQWRDAVVVTYDANGGYIEWTGEETYQLVTSDFVYPKHLETYSVLSDEKKVFDGWYEDQACTKPAKEKYLPDKNYTFYAKWTDAVEITYNGNGGEVLGEERHVQKYKKNTFNYYAYANKEGSYFDGWFLDKACTKRVSEGTNRAFMDKDLVLYAGYVDTYTFTYDANGGYFNDNQQKTMVNTVKKGETEYISDYLQLYNRNKSLAFDGWYMDKELTQPAGDRCKMTKDTTVYAKWSPACTITFDPNGGKIYGWSGAAQFSVLKGRKFNQNFYMNVYSDDSYVVFDGWYYDKEGTKAVDLLNDTWTKDTTVYAKWSKTCGITYDANGGYFPSELTTTRLTEEKVVGGMLLGTPAPESLDNKMLFAGWYTDKALTQPLDEENYVVKGAATFYAKYVRGNVVTFDANGGYITDSQDTTKSVTLEKESALSEYMAPKVSGNGNKVAIGWSTEKDGSNIIEDLDSFVPEKDTTLYAVWEEGYTITFDGNGGYLSDREGTYYVPSMKEVYKKNTDMYWVSFPMTSHPDDNMTFVGWYKDKGLTEQVNTKDDDVDKDMTLYAKWEKTVQVTFDANGWAFSDSGS